MAIPGQLAALARRLGVIEQTDQAETIQALWDELRQRDRWLLVFDNTEDPRDLRSYWPPGGHGHILVTSRNPAWGGLASTLPVDVLPRAEAIAFLARRLGRDDPIPEFDRLAAALGDLPLALEQAAAYLEETATPTGEYLSLLNTNAKELFALGRPASTEQTIATTWTVSLRRLRQQTPAAEDLLVLCAFLDPENIPRSLPTQHPDVLPERLAVTVRAPLPYQQAIGALRRYSLIKTSQDGHALSVHRLVQAVVRNRLDPAAAASRAGVAVRLLAEAFPEEGFSDPGVWAQCARLLPHGLAAADHGQHYQVESVATSNLLNQAGRYLQGRGWFSEAGQGLERALALDEATSGPDDPITAQSLNNLAEVLRDQGDPNAARTLFERALVIRETSLGPDNPTTASSLSNLAIVLFDQGDLEGARNPTTPRPPMSSPTSPMSWTPKAT